MKTFLYLDDDAFQKSRKPKNYYKFIGAYHIMEILDSFDKVQIQTTVEGSIDYIKRNGCPNFISFDNDLQRELEGYDLAKWIVEMDLDHPGFIPDDFGFFVHSQNPIAARKIMDYLNQYLEKRCTF